MLPLPWLIGAAVVGAAAFFKKAIDNSEQTLRKERDDREERLLREKERLLREKLKAEKKADFNRYMKEEYGVEFGDKGWSSSKLNKLKSDLAARKRSFEEEKRVLIARKKQLSDRLASM